MFEGVIIFKTKISSSSRIKLKQGILSFSFTYETQSELL
jgi:hypothetical protein